MLLLVAATLVAGVTSAAPATSKGSFEVLVEDNVASADNGDTITVSLEGAFNGATKEATGAGIWTHRRGSTVIGSGTLTLERLLSFQFYGCGVIDGITLPADFCGGRALYAVHLVAGPPSSLQFDGTLEVNCQIGSPPAGTTEGIKLVVKDVINFNNHVEGGNLFVAE